HAEQPWGTGAMLGEREHQTRHDHGDGNEHVRDCTAQTGEDCVERTVPGHRRPCGSSLRDGADALQKEKTPADRKNHQTSMVTHARPPWVPGRRVPERNCLVWGRTSSLEPARGAGAPRVCGR